MPRRFKTGQTAVKRTLDFAVAAGALLACSPVMVTIGIAVRITMGRPVLFAQLRPGLRGSPFVMYKFRTMAVTTDAKGTLLPDGARLTPLGRLLRSASLDELPQLWNVLRGEMSLVGPRPLLLQYLERYSATQARRHEVRPGITGWAQVNGRNALTWDEKFALDVWYVDNWDLCVDVRILARTILRVLRREGISNDHHATMPEFVGNVREQHQ